MTLTTGSSAPSASLQMTQQVIDRPDGCASIPRD